MYHQSRQVAILFLLFLFPSSLFAGEAPPLVVKHHEQAHVIGMVNAIEAAIKRNPDVLIQQQTTAIQEGVLQENAGAFNTTLASSVTRSLNYTPLSLYDQHADFAPNILRPNVITNTTTYDVAAVKTLRSGITLEPNVQVTHAADNLPRAWFIETQPNYSTVNFTITVPLLRGFGEDATDASEIAARLKYESSESSLKHVIALTTLHVVQAYWGAVAAKNNLQIAKDGEAVAQKMVHNFKILIAKDQFPSASMHQIAANLAAKTSERIRAEQAYLEARQQLALAMGMPALDMADAPSPMNDFSEMDIKSITATADVRAITRKAMQNRQDLIALKQSKQAADTLLTAAQLNLKPKLDLSFNVGYDSRVIGGTNAATQLSYQFPVGNDVRRGKLAQSIAEDEQVVIQTDNLARTITSEVTVAISAMYRSAVELEKSKEAVALSKDAVVDERKKLAMGMSTIINVINLQNNYISQLLNETSAKLNYANALVKLRYATGTLISATSKNYSIGLDSLTKIPAFL